MSHKDHEALAAPNDLADGYLLACPGREHREPRRDGREHAAVASSVLGPRGLRVNGQGACRGQPQRRTSRIPTPAC